MALKIYSKFTQRKFKLYLTGLAETALRQNIKQFKKDTYTRIFLCVIKKEGASINE
jgi:hypothetical protein